MKLAIDVQYTHSSNNISSDYAIYRGQSQKPLYITSIGIDIHRAKKNISAMQGQYRIPTLLKQADQLCRGIIV